jgi:hypothetical protein
MQIPVRRPSRVDSTRVARCAAFALAFGATLPVQASAQDVIRFGASLSLTGGTSAEGKRVKDGYDFYASLPAGRDQRRWQIQG